jgi:fermentation-respiration switch protein FrsA (DUF1100 family)
VVILLALSVGVTRAQEGLEEADSPAVASAEAGTRPGEAAAMAEEAPVSRTRQVLRMVARIVIAVAVVGILAGAALLFFEDRFVFRPSPEPASSWKPEGLGVEQCYFLTRDGVGLYGWWHPGPDTDDDLERPVVLWCHGNAGNLSHREANLRSLVDSGLAVFIFDYRGYGQSDGRPSELGLYTDVEAAYDYLVRERGASPRRIVFFGRSLGAAVALHGALRRRSAGLIMEGAFENVPAIVRRSIRVPFLPSFIRNQFDNLMRLPMLRVPLLVIHGREDSVVPFVHGENVFAAAPEPKEFYAVAGAGHDDTYVVDAAGWHETFTDFARRCVGGGVTAGQHAREK